MLQMVVRQKLESSSMMVPFLLDTEGYEILHRPTS